MGFALRLVFGKFLGNTINLNKGLIMIPFLPILGGIAAVTTIVKNINDIAKS
jgi:hypothetical protein